MALSALERLDLSDRLDDLMIQAMTAKGLDLLDLNDEMEAVMVKMGYGATVPATPPTIEQPPSIVTDFLSGKFIAQAQMDFVDTLRQVGQYLDKFLSLDDMKVQANSWLTQNNYSM